MSVQIKHVDPLGGLHLADGGSLQRSRLLHEVVLGQDLILSADPTQTIAGRQNLGEGTQIDHQTLGVKALQGRQIVAFKAQFAIGIVLNNRDLVLVDDIHELMPAIQIPSAACGVLEIGDDIDHLHALGGGQDLFQLFHDHAAIIGGNFNKGRLASLEGVDSAQIGGAFQQHHVAGVQEHTGGEIQTLLRTGGHQNVVSVGVDIVLCQHTLGDLLAQTGITFGGRILQCHAAIFL